MSVIALLATAGVYGVVALIVRMDDSGFYLIERARILRGIKSKLANFLGKLLIQSLPKVIHILAIIGTIAMLLVGGGMFVHNIDSLHQYFSIIPVIVADLIMGLVIGLISFVLISTIKFIKTKI